MTIERPIAKAGDEGTMREIQLVWKLSTERRSWVRRRERLVWSLKAVR